MQNCLKKIFSVVIIIQFALQLNAQTRTNDAVGWFSLSVKQKIYKNLSYRAIARVRDGENFTTIKSYYVDAGLYLNIKNNFSISINYVYAPSRTDDHYFRVYHQYYTSINNKIKLNKLWYVSNRVIFQYSSSFFIVDEGYKPYSRTDAREKLTLNRRLTRSDRIYVANEIMTTLFTENLELRRNRVYLGVNHKFTKQLSADLFFVLQSTFNRKNNTNNFVYGFTLNYKFKKMLDDD